MEKLTTAERMSPTWAKLKAEFERELQILREKNDKDSPDELTAKIRGRIAMLKDIIKLGQEDKPLL